MDQKTAQEYLDENNKKADEETSLVTPDDLPDSISQGVRKDDGEIRRIVIDRQACIGAGSCVVVAEQTYQLDEENLAYIVDPDAHDQDTIMLSAQACPVLAIHLYNKDGKKIFP
ncbi:MAG: ferredoxin [Candidatus Magasanikbacteria bacterium]|jgi:ferredoxin|nr:ferredoxin [Candidatus Magasanikbacteria bacterium]